MPDKLPAEIVVLPAVLFRREWVFRLVTSVYADDTGGGFSEGYGEAEYRAALAEQGYDDAQIDWAVAEALEEGKATPPEPDNDKAGEDYWGIGQDHPNKELVDSMPLILQCSACGMRVGLGDDPTNRAMWEADFIENDGWDRTPEGLLICDECASPREPRELGPPSCLTTAESAASAAPDKLGDIPW